MLKKILLIFIILIFILTIFKLWNIYNPRNIFNNKLVMSSEIMLINQITQDMRNYKINNCSLTNSGLANCFNYSKYSKTADIPIINDNVIKNKWGTKWTFTSNGECLNSEECFIKIDFKNTFGSNKKIKLSLLKDKENYLYIDLYKEYEKIGLSKK